MEQQMIYIGINGSVIALDSTTGTQIWRRSLKGSGFVTVALDKFSVYAAAEGEIFCMDKQTGTPHWHNPLKRCGTGLVSIAVMNPSSSNDNDIPPIAEKHRQTETTTDPIIGG